MPDPEEMPEQEKEQAAYQSGVEGWKAYIQTEDDVELMLTGEESGCVMLDANRPKLDQSQAERDNL